jgi:hypothetical protein
MSAIPLRSLIGDLDPKISKLHCAVWNGEDHPIDVLTRSWDEWVESSRWRPARDEFNRPYIFAMARDRNDPSHWLFGGVFEVLERHNKPYAHSYKIALREDLMGPFIKRLWVEFRPPGRAIRLNMETHLDQINVVSILELPYAGEPFPGHDRINHSLGVLETAVTQDWNDWRGALQYMKGVYVIHDQETGQAYVGSACGDTGIWSRLRGRLPARQQRRSPRTGRTERASLCAQESSLRAAGVLVHANCGRRGPGPRELWKDVLLSRKFGLNKN